MILIKSRTATIQLYSIQSALKSLMPQSRHSGSVQLVKMAKDIAIHLNGTILDFSRTIMMEWKRSENSFGKIFGGTTR